MTDKKMNTLPYTIIKSRAQYNRYCKQVEALLDSNSSGKAKNDELELLTLLIEKYDSEHTTLDAEVNPVDLLKSFMDEAQMKAVDMALLLGVSKGLVSDILNYKKGMSKEIIRKLAERFKVRQELFNQPYKLQLPRKAGRQQGRSTSKKLQTPLHYYKTERENVRVAVKEPGLKYGKQAGKK